RLEIWDRAAWAAYNDQLAGDISDISELLGNTAA
ncbi:MAG: cell division/cell wall cluster transcriptional repressor MraZ, partial [Solirubrobacterales bacterium]|nr:cell division/cell wall cluster transcriptional repressor MraZ [Solirubrobacterales bacterium]